MKERANRGVFDVTPHDPGCNTLRGGVLQGLAKKCYKTIFSYLYHSTAVIHC